MAARSEGPRASGVPDARTRTGLRRPGIVVLVVLLAVVGGAVAVAAVRRPPPVPALDERLPLSAVSRCAPGVPTPRLPAAGMPYAAMAARARADLLALSGSFPDQPDPDRASSAGVCGAAVAAWRPFWRYVWPRDASFAVAALSVTGDRARAAEVLDFLARVAPPDGRWAARYLPDGSGRRPDAERPFQADGGGWLCWAVWSAVTLGPTPFPVAATARWWPMLTASADELAGQVERTGLPATSPDYWETDTDRPTLEVATATVVGLRAATDLAVRTGRDGQARRWGAAARRAADALAQRWGPRGYPRTLPAGGADAAVGLTGWLLGDLPGVPDAVGAARRLLRVGNGGVSPGQQWGSDRRLGWTPEMAMLAIGSVRTDRAGALADLSWLDGHRSPSGSLPEKVGPAGEPASVAPLGWTASLVLLTLADLDTPLTVPPAPPG